MTDCWSTDFHLGLTGIPLAIHRKRLSPGSRRYRSTMTEHVACGRLRFDPHSATVEKDVPFRLARRREGPVIEHDLDSERSILHVRPKSALAPEDFAELASVVDPHIESAGDLAGIIIETSSFPGWEGLGAMASHIRFVRDHHRHVRKVAVVTDSALGKVAERLASHFVSAEIKRFPAGETQAARQWISSRK